MNPYDHAWTYDFSTTVERLDDLQAQEEMERSAAEWYEESARVLNAYAAAHGEPPFDADYLDDEYDEYRELDWIERQERAA